MQYTQSNTSTQTVNISSLRRSDDGTPTFCRRSAAVSPTCHIGDPDNSVKNNGSLDTFSSKPVVYLLVLVNYLKFFGAADFNTG